MAMKHMLYACAGILALAVNGCVVVSLYPLSGSDDQLVQDDRFVGVWSNGSTIWTVRPAGTSYLAIREEGELRSAYDARLTRLAGHLFLDLQPHPTPDQERKSEYHVVYGHTVSRLEFVRDTLRVYMLAVPRPDAAPAASRDTLPYLTGYESSNDYLTTLPTERLRDFAGRHADDPIWFRETAVFVRQH